MEICRAIVPSEHSFTTDLTPHALRRLCEEGPVVCIIEARNGESGGLWADLATLFAHEIARDLPLLLVLGLDGPAQLGPHADEEPDALNVARQLTADHVDLATWHWLQPLSEEDVRAWLGPATSELVQSLLEMSDGHAGATAALWDDWRLRGVVDAQADLQWRFSLDREYRVNPDAFAGRLQHLVGNDVNALSARPRHVGLRGAPRPPFRRLGCGGRARARSGQHDRLPDDVLTVGDENPHGFLIEDGFDTIEDENGTRHLAMYRFARELDWLLLRRRGTSDAERYHLSQRLAIAIEASYGGQAHRVAFELSRLFDAAGNRERYSTIGGSLILVLGATSSFGVRAGSHLRATCVIRLSGGGRHSCSSRRPTC